MKTHLPTTLIVLFLITGCQVFGNTRNSPPDPCESIKWSEISAKLKEKDYSKAADLVASFEFNRCSMKATDSANIPEDYQLANTVVLKKNIIDIMGYGLSQDEKIETFLFSIAKEAEPSLAISAITRLTTSSKELLEIYQLRKEDKIREAILEKLDSKVPGVTDLYVSILREDNKILAPLAFSRLVQLEDNHNWQTWQWSDQISKLFEDAVNKRLYLLKNFSDLELLEISNHYPNSLFTKGCKEYRSIIGGQEGYFSPGSYYTDGENKSIFRQPFLASAEKVFWSKFIKKYADHPSIDNALYRLARLHEMEGDYENALLLYYESASADVGIDMQEFAPARTLLLMDFAMDSKALKRFLENHSQHPLAVYGRYIYAIHLARENDLKAARLEMDKFVTDYQDKFIPSALSSSDYLNTQFWKNVKAQTEQLKELEMVSQLPASDENLYRQAIYYFDNYLVLYNYLWRGQMQNQIGKFLPGKWTNQTSILFSMNSDFVAKINKSWSIQSGRLASASLLERLLQEYPQSNLREKSTYMIAVNYYRLVQQSNTPIQALGDFSGSWEERAITKFRDFLDKFPNSSMADDALLSICEIRRKQPTNISRTGNTEVDNAAFKRERIRILQLAEAASTELLQRYSGGDRAKEARRDLAEIQNEITSLASSN
jgi:Tetratricopeptide repeat